MEAGALITSLVIDPANVMQGGVGSDSRLVVIEKADLAGYTRNGLDIITALTLAANKSAFFIEGIRQSAKPKWERVPADSGQSVFKHIMDFIYFGYDQVSKNNCGRLAQ